MIIFFGIGVAKQFIKIVKKIKKYAGIFFLLIFPMFLSLYWFVLEYNKIDILHGFEIKGGFMQPEEFHAVLANAKNRYDTEKNTFPIDLPKEIEAIQVSEYHDFNKEIIKKFTNIIGSFSLLPIYSICLRNNNIIYSENERISKKYNTIGAIGIIQKQGAEYKFYAPVGGKDCQYVFKNKFINNSFRVEYSYAILSEIGPEDRDKILKGEEYRIYVRSFKIDSTKSDFVIRLSWWAVILSYFLLLLAWSYVFFQFQKIKNYVMKSVALSKKQVQ